jgi:hypothetical protein
MPTMRVFLLTATLLTTCCALAAPPQEKTWVPTTAQVQELEKHLTQPVASKLALSTRYYFGFYEHGRRVIRGEILHPEMEHDPTIHIDQNFPLIMDGGCGVITLSYNPATHTVLSSRCNGQG